MLRKKLIVSSIFSSCAIIALLISIILVSGAMAFGWFSANMGVSATGMNVSIQNDGFKLSIPSSAGYSSTLTDHFSSEGYVASLATDSTNTKIFCKITTESAETTIEPGSYGVISFDIVSENDAFSSFNIDLLLRGVAVVYNVVDDERVRTLEDLDPEDPDDAITLELLYGHIMIFENRTPITGNTGPYYYSGHIESNYIYNLSSHQSDKQVVNGENHYHVKLYWVWPLSFAQMVYPESDTRLNTNTLIDNVTERQALINYIGSNPSKYFYWTTPKSINYSSGYEQSQANYNTLSEGYNNGDQRMGDNIRYLVVEITVNPN